LIVLFSLFYLFFFKEETVNNLADFSNLFYISFDALKIVLLVGEFYSLKLVLILLMLKELLLFSCVDTYDKISL